LLEEKCLNDVRNEHAGEPISESDIIIEARNKYEHLFDKQISVQNMLITVSQIPGSQRPAR
jgi:pyruvate/oxaloacetate carboxyltransferase